jgi:hypothetical protein
VVLMAAAGVVVFFSSPASTGSVTTYQPVPLQGGVQNRPDPGTQYLRIEAPMCEQDLVTILTWIDFACEKANPGRVRRKADCRYKAELDLNLKCRTAPVFANIRPPRYITGEVAVDPLSCAVLAENYDFVLQQTLARSQTPQQTIAMINPCTDTAGAAMRQTLLAEAPLREYVRTAFPDGSVAGSIAGEEDRAGQVRYVRCADGTARVVVSGVPVCNTLG